MCGGRNYRAAHHVNRVLDALPREDLTIVQGGASGADRLAKDWAHTNDVPCEEYPAEWRKFGGAAGHIRNEKMLSTGIDLVVAFPGGRGTADMVRRAEAAGVRIQLA